MEARILPLPTQVRPAMTIAGSPVTAAGRGTDRARRRRADRRRAARPRGCAPSRPRSRSATRRSAPPSWSARCASACWPSRTPRRRWTWTSSGASSRSSSPQTTRRQRAGGPRRRGRPARELRGRRRPAAADPGAVPRGPRRAPEVRQGPVRRDEAGLRHRAHRRAARPVLRRGPVQGRPAAGPDPPRARRSTSSARRSPRGSRASTSA